MRYAFLARLLAICATGGTILTFAANKSDDLRLQRKAGQLLWVGYHSLEQIKSIRPSGIVYFGWNIRDARQLQSTIVDLRNWEAASLAPRALTALDHEGGKVIRLKKGVSFVPDASALAATHDTELVEKIAFLMSRELRNIGIDVNFAPVMDRGDAMSFLENRTWGEDGETISQMTHAFLEGHLKGGAFPFPKHFPGHGMQAYQDAHQLKTVNNESKARIIARDMLPFNAVINDPRFGALMTAHVEVPALDRGPASLSKKVLTDFLRTELGYRGFVLSDDLEMAAAQSYGQSLGDIALKSLQSGVDAVLIVWSLEEQFKVRDRIVEAMRSGELPEYEVDQKIAHIEKLRSRVTDTREASEKFPALSFQNKKELISQAWDNSEEWVLGTEATLHEQFAPQAQTAWNVVVPPGPYAQLWKSFRPQDRVLRHDHRIGENRRLLAILTKKLGQTSPIVIVTPPMHEDAGEWVKGLTKLLNRAYKQTGPIAPTLWVHMGAQPVKVPRIERPAKAFSLVLLHSATTTSLRHFMRVIGSADHTWNSVSQKSYSSLPSP